MYKLLSCIAILFLSLNASAQKTYTVFKDPENGSQVFKGELKLGDLSAEPTFTWYGKGMGSYKPDSASINYLRGTLPKYTIVTLMGTWCEDSQNLIPKLAKTLQDAAFPVAKFQLYGVDRSKKTNGIEAQTYNVKLVPTIIIFRGTEEVGRIVETVKDNIETDLAQIILKAEG